MENKGKIFLIVISSILMAGGIFAFIFFVSKAKPDESKSGCSCSGGSGSGSGNKSFVSDGTCPCKQYGGKVWAKECCAK